MKTAAKVFAIPVSVLLLFGTFAACGEPTPPLSDDSSTKNAIPETDGTEESLREFESAIIVHGVVEPRNVSQEPTNPEYIRAFVKGEVRRLESFSVCNNVEDYQTYRQSVCGMFSSAEETAFPLIADEWFDQHALACVFVSAWCTYGDWQKTRILYEKTESGCLYLMIGMEGIGSKISSLDPEPYVIGSFLYGFDKQEASPVTDVMTETYMLGNDLEYLYQANQEAETYLTAQSPRLSGSVSKLFSQNISIATGEEVSTEDALYYSAEEGLVYDEKYADVTVEVRLTLKPSLLRDAKGDQSFIGAETAVYQSFFLEHGISQVYLDYAYGRIDLPLTDASLSEGIPLRMHYISATPRLLSELLDDPRVALIYC